MRKLTKSDLDELRKTMNVIPTEEQRYYLGMGSYNQGYNSGGGNSSDELRAACYFEFLALQDGTVSTGEVYSLAYDYFAANMTGRMDWNTRTDVANKIKEKHSLVGIEEVYGSHSKELVDEYLKRNGGYVDKDDAYKDYKARGLSGELMWIKNPGALSEYPLHFSDENEEHMVVAHLSNNKKRVTITDYSNGQKWQKTYTIEKLANDGVIYTIWNGNGEVEKENDGSGFSSSNGGSSSSSSGNYYDDGASSSSGNDTGDGASGSSGNDSGGWGYGDSGSAGDPYLYY